MQHFPTQAQNLVVAIYFSIDSRRCWHVVQ